MVKKKSLLSFLEHLDLTANLVCRFIFAWIKFAMPLAPPRISEPYFISSLVDLIYTIIQIDGQCTTIPKFQHLHLRDYKSYKSRHQTRYVVPRYIVPISSSVKHLAALHTDLPKTLKTNFNLIKV